jgi:hypothetical protein
MVAAIASSSALAASDRAAERFVSSVGIRLLTDGINQVLRSFGPAPVAHLQQFRERRVCYLRPNAPVRSEIGDEGVGARFELMERPSPVPGNCAQVKHSFATARLDGAGLRLGMKEDDFIALVGTGTDLARAEVTFTYFKLRRNTNGMPGAPEFAFMQSGVMRSVGKYCDVEQAFNEELRLPKPGIVGESRSDATQMSG